MIYNITKFIHSNTGKKIMSILLGFGLASLFRSVCKNKECLAFYAPPLEQITNKIYKKDNGKCIRYKEVSTSCNSNAKIINFE
jgi:hypothetical protein